MAKLYIVGLGPGRPEGMTLEARAALEITMNTASAREEIPGG